MKELKQLFKPGVEVQTKRFYKAVDNLPRPKRLFNVDRNAKTVKGRKRQYMTAILYLAPAKTSGYQTCPKASEGCKEACLNTAGHGAMHVNQIRRIRKTRYFFQQRQDFMLHLERELAHLTKKAAREGMELVVRLNGTSDILWEHMSFTGKDGETYASLMDRFPELQFYDYTKHEKKRRLPVNYDLTFSATEANDNAARLALAAGTNVAVVFRGVVPGKFWGATTLDGDKDDLRFLDKKGGRIVALKAKGKARYDESGFVKEVN